MAQIKFVLGGIFLLLLSAINFDAMVWPSKLCVLFALALYAFGMLLGNDSKR